MDCNYDWVNKYLNYDKLKIFNNISEFKSWLIRQKKRNENDGDGSPPVDYEEKEELIEETEKVQSSNFRNAIDYLEDLRETISKKWFDQLSLFAINSSGGPLDNSQLEIVRSIFLSNNQFKLKNSINPNFNSTKERKRNKQLDIFSTNTDSQKLEYLGNFENFKNLGNELNVNFSTPITIIFGTNTSGKTSICHAIKKLTGDSIQEVTDKNILKNTECSTSFKYKFTTDKNKEVYYNDSNVNQRYSMRGEIKYFDSKISARLIENPNTERLLKVAPFKLEKFEYLQNSLDQFKNYMRDIMITKKGEISKKVNHLKLLFAKQGITKLEMYDELEEGEPRNFFEVINCDVNEREGIVNRAQELDEKIERLSQSSSPEKIRVLNLEVQRLKKNVIVIEKLKDRIIELNIPEQSSINANYDNLKLMQKKSMKFIVPNQHKIEEFKKFIKISKNIINYDEEIYDDCLFCKRTLDELSMDIIKQYYAFLRSDLEEKIGKIETLLKQREKIKRDIAEYEFDDVFNPELLSSEETVENILPTINQIIKYCSGEIEEASFFKEHREQLIREEILKSEITKIKMALNDKEREMKELNISYSEKKRLIIEIKKEKEMVDFKKTFFKYWEENYLLYSDLCACSTLKEKIESADFRSIKTRITNKNKNATNYLIKSSFEEKLNREYQSLTKKQIENSGIITKATKVGKKVDLAVSIKGKHPLRTILSEGELKIYSLALFFVEIEYDKKSTVVFDDPVSSLDYIYTENLTRRIKKFAQENLDKQIIVFTHDWYFLKGIQDELIKSDFKEGRDFSLLVLESCSNVNINIEKLGKIKSYINSILKKEKLLKNDKILLCRHMRVFIEAMINKYVFNEQRMQYKRDKTNPGVFKEYVKLRRLTEEEANTFYVLYNDLSIHLHDNDQQDFTSWDGKVFKSYYDRLLILEEDLRIKNPIDQIYPPLSPPKINIETVI